MRVNRKMLFAGAAVLAMCLCGCGSGSKGAAGVDTDSLSHVINKEGVEVTLSVDYPTADTTLQTALAQYVRSAMLDEVPDSAGVGGEALLASCADVMWRYMREPLSPEEDEMPLDGETAEEDSEIPTAEELAMYGGDAPQSYYMAAFPKIYDTEEYVTWQCQWELYSAGSAHPSAGLTGATFRKADGRRLGADMLKDTDSEGFRQLLRDALRQYVTQEWGMSVGSDEELANMLNPGLQLDALPLPAQAPYLTPDGVALPYQEYELSGRSIVVLVLPYESVKPYLENEIMRK